MTQIVIRFLVGGLVVSSFAIIGDILRPKSFAGLFGAAPSVAGLMVFAVLIWRLMPGYRVWPVLLLATVVWLAVSVLSWKVRKARKSL